MVKVNGYSAGYAVVLGAAVFGGAMPAMAADECGPVGADTVTITCSADTAGFPDFPTGITYKNLDAGLTLILDDAAFNIGNTFNTGRGVEAASSTDGIGDIIVKGTNVGTVTTREATRSGLKAQIFNPASTATVTVLLTAGEIVTNGRDASGVEATTLGLGDALVQMDGGTVTTNGLRSAGLSAAILNPASTATVTVLMTAGKIVANGRDASGVLLTSLSPSRNIVTISGDSKVMASGPNGLGIQIVAGHADSTYVVAVNDTAVVTGGSSGEAAAGIKIASVADSRGTVDIAVLATVGATINGAAGIIDGAGDTTVNVAGTVRGDIELGGGSDRLNIASTAVITDVALLDGGADSDDRLTLTGQTLTYGGVGLTNWETLTVDGGSLEITDSALTVGSDLAVGSGLIVTNAAIFDAGTGLTLTGNLTTTAGGRFTGEGAGAGAYSVSGSVSNNGIITMQDGFAGDMLTVLGDYTGTGTLLVDVNFTTGKADKLVVDGDVESGVTIAGRGGKTALRVVSTGAPTGDNGNPIVVVNVAGIAESDAFILVGEGCAVGVYSCLLQQRVASSDFVLDVGTTLNSTGTTYDAAPSVLGGAFNRLPTLEQRVGGRAKRAGQAAWIRLHGDNSEASLTSGSSIDSSSWGFQAGADFDFEPGQNGRWVIGVTGQYGDLSSTIAAASTGSGSIDTTGYGLGATATWYGNEGSYVDVQGQVNWLDSDLASSAAGSLVSGQSSTAYALSVEGGHRFALGQNAALIPQAQVTWGSVDGGSFTDSIGNAVNLGTNNSTIGRFGLAYEFNKNDAQKVYVIGNFLHDFSDDTAVSVAGGSNLTAAAASPTWAELGIGGSMAFGNMQVYGESAYRTALGGSRTGSDKGLSGTLGLRFKW